MKLSDVILLLVLGLVIWVLGTVYYAYTGRAVLETTPQRYWVSLVISPILSAAISVAILRWREIGYSEWASALLLLAIPGMIGEAVVLIQLATFMPRIQVSSGGRYAALLFTTYAVVLGMGEAVSLSVGR